MGRTLEGHGAAHQPPAETDRVCEHLPPRGKGLSAATGSLLRPLARGVLDQLSAQEIHDVVLAGGV